MCKSKNKIGNFFKKIIYLYFSFLTIATKQVHVPFGLRKLIQISYHFSHYTHQSNECNDT